MSGLDPRVRSPQPSAESEFRRLESLFKSALEQPAEQRGAWLRSQPIDARLLDELFALLEAHELPLPALAQLITGEARALLPPGTRVGEFVLLERLGQGAAGTVYRARGLEGQEVALKLLRADVALAWQRRFEREGQLLGRLDHPGIVRLLGHGLYADLDGDRPYLVLELVPGARTLRTYAAEAQRSLEVKVRLLAEVAEALAHAHGRGVAHRDLKPENVLVDAAERVRLIDFGLGRDLGQTPLAGATASQALLGTAWYMAPEQFERRGGVDPRSSDIYSFGVLAYELLAGRLPQPLEGVQIPEIARRICELPPAPLPRELGALQRPLTRILEAALSKDPSRRAAGAANLARDLRGILHGRAPESRPPSALARLSWAARRHPRFAALSAAGALALSASWVHTLGSALDARAAAATEQAQRVLAQDALLALTQALAGSDPRSLMTGFRTPSHALDQLEELLHSGPQLAPSIRALIAYLSAGRAISEGRWEPADALLEQALIDWRRAVPAQPAQLSRGLSMLASLQLERGEFSAAVATCEASVAEAERSGQPQELLRSRCDLAMALLAAGRLEEAEGQQRAAQAENRSIPPGEFASAFQLARLEGALAEASHDGEAAIAAYTQAHALAAEHLGATNHQTLVSKEQLGRVLASRGRFDDAEGHYREVLEQRERRLGSDHPDTLGALGHLALLLDGKGELEAAIPVWEDLVERQLRVSGATHPQTLIVRHNLAASLFDLGKREPAHLESALALTRENIAGWEARGESQHPEALKPRQNEANILLEMGRNEEAIPKFEALLADRRRLLGDADVATLNTMGSLATTLERAGQPERSRQLQAEVLALAAAHYPIDDPNHFIGHARAARMAMRRNDLGEAQRLVSEALERLEGRIDSRHPIVAALLRVRTDLQAAQPPSPR